MACGLNTKKAKNLQDQLNALLTLPAESAWHTLSKKILKPSQPLLLHQCLFSSVYPNWQQAEDFCPIWVPRDADIQITHLAALMKSENLSSLKALHRWSIEHSASFWQQTIERLGIKFQTSYSHILDDKSSPLAPKWLVGAHYNIIDSCFKADKAKTALIAQNASGELATLSYMELDKASNQVANGLLEQGFKPKDCIGLMLAMSKDAVIIYLGIIKAGCTVVSIADSFSQEEVTLRLKIPQARALFVQDTVLRPGKTLNIYARVKDCPIANMIVVGDTNKNKTTLAKNHLYFADFLSAKQTFTPVCQNAAHPINILFSSGTTGEPKAIPWDQTTPIKAAMDAYFHLDVHHSDILAWPTNLGWMMGPWLIYAALLNNATLAIFEDAPNTLEYCRFVEKARVSMLGVVPTLVNNWRKNNCLDQVDWTNIQRFASTGECSNTMDMFYLSAKSGYKPIIEYCGGTEIGGAYLTSTLIEPNILSCFSTPALSMDIVLFNEQGIQSNSGEVAIIPPSIGLSTRVLNRDHHKVYFEHMPKIKGHKVLRRHGDKIKKLPFGYYRLEGRIDDTMNLNGIKVGSIQIERALKDVPGISECAAIGQIPKAGGPCQLIIFAVSDKKKADINSAQLKTLMQQKINTRLNPLFKINQVKFLQALPKTASNKIIRNELNKR